MDDGILQCFWSVLSFTYLSVHLADAIVANALGIFSPSVTLVIYAIVAATRGHSLDTEIAFTTMAILSMVTHPANMIMTIVPRAVAAFAGFDRIQSFLLKPSLPDYRGSIPKASLYRSPEDMAEGQSTKLSLAIAIQQLTVGANQPILENINIDVASESITLILGPVGSGKSTLLRSVLGESVPVHGTIKLSTRKIAYCAQKPWLPSGTIKEVIQGSNITEDEKWYNEVIEMCCLTYDFKSLPDGDKTQIGSRGLNISGGQRQRLVSLLFSFEWINLTTVGSCACLIC